eukprot:Gb_24598 [translate_table: standard]
MEKIAAYVSLCPNHGLHYPSSISCGEYHVGFASHSMFCLPNFPFNRLNPVASSENIKGTNSTKMGKTKEPWKKRERKPSASELEKALGVSEATRSKSGRKGFGALMEDEKLEPFLSKEGEFERMLRKAGDWLIEKTERGPRKGEEIFTVFLLYLFPVWFFFLLLTSGVIKLPFSIPFLQEYIE